MASQVEALSRRAKERIGTVLRGKWRIERLLGVGGMAAVYAGTHRNGKRGAIKLMHRDLADDPDAKSRFLHEGYVANRLDHPGAVSVLDDDVAEDGSLFLVMELLEGRSVDAIAWARPGHRLGPAEALNIVDQLLDVLAVAHDKGIVHRDLKPENLFLTPGGVIKVLDFGIARIRELDGDGGGGPAENAGAATRAASLSRPASAHLTQTGNAMGTPAFMPPEQALGKWDQVDARTDLWAAGATLFTLLTGRQVHEAPDLNMLMAAAMTRKAPPIRGILPELPEGVAAVVDRALAFDRQRRWQSAREMQRAVREVGRALPGFTDPPGAATIPGAAPVEAERSGLGSPSLLGATLLRDRSARPRSGVLRIAIGIAVLASAAATVAIVALGGSGPPAQGGSLPGAAAAPEPSAPVIAPVTVTPAPGVTVTATATASTAVGGSAPEPSAAASTSASVTTSAAASGPAKPSKKAGPSPAKSDDPFLKWE